MHQLTTSGAFNQNIQKLVTPYIKALQICTKCDSNTHMTKSRSRRLLFEKLSITCSVQILICLCGRSTEQVPAGILDPCRILTVNNIFMKNNNNNDNINNKITSYSGDRLTRPHMVIPPQQIPPSIYGACSANFISVPVHALEPSTLENLCCNLHRPKFRIQKVPTKWLLTKSHILYTVEKTLYTRFRGGIFGTACRRPKCHPLTCRLYCYLTVLRLRRFRVLKALRRLKLCLHAFVILWAAF